MDNHVLGFLDNTFDYIVSRNVTWILYNPEKAFKEWFRVLKPGGRLVYFDSNWPYDANGEFVNAQKINKDKYQMLYGETFNSYRGDEKTDQEFRKVLYFHKIWRPTWDEQHLPEYGYCNIEIMPMVNERVYDKSLQLLYRDMPMFVVSAEKGEKSGM